MSAVETSLKDIDSNLNRCRNRVGGVNQPGPLLNSSLTRYVNLDHAASTPSPVPVQDRVNRVLEWYSSIHLGSDFKLLLSSRAYDSANPEAGDFVATILSYETGVGVRHGCFRTHPYIKSFIEDYGGGIQPAQRENQKIVQS